MPKEKKNEKGLGIGRLLIVVYGVFALAATARALFQILTKFEQAPVAYSLSLVSAIVYILATIALAMPQLHHVALVAVGFELVGVVLVGALSFLTPDLFAHPSVWSGFGSGYGYIPLALPILGLIWLRKSSKA